MADDRLPKSAPELREEGRRRRGRPMLRGEDCVKRDVRKAGEEEDWKNKTRDRGGCKRLSVEAVKKLQAAHHPRLREKEEERNMIRCRPTCTWDYSFKMWRNITFFTIHWHCGCFSLIYISVLVNYMQISSHTYWYFTTYCDNVYYIYFLIIILFIHLCSV